MLPRRSSRLSSHLPDHYNIAVRIGRTRIRTRLNTENTSRDELSEMLQHALSKAGNATLMTPELMQTLVDHAAGNYRLMMTMAAELLAFGSAQEVAQLDEKFYLELFQLPGTKSSKKARR